MIGSEYSRGSRCERHGPGAVFPWMLLALGIAVAHSPALAQGGGRGAQLEDLLPRLARRAAIYKETALRFACVEEVTRTEFNKEETVKKEESVVHDYLLENTRRSGLRPYRAILSRNDKETNRHQVKPDYETPEPYAWQLLFVESGQGRFQFELIDQEFVNPHDTWVIDFIALASYATGNRIEEWDGTVWVDQDTLDILRVKARPSKEAETLEARLAEYRQAFRVLGMSTKKKPRSRSLTVEFNLQREELRFPSRSLYAVHLVDEVDVRRPESGVVQRFRDYVFFDVESLDKFKAMQETSP